jgi:hypothetical protein
MGNFSSFFETASIAVYVNYTGANIDSIYQTVVMDWLQGYANFLTIEKMNYGAAFSPWVAVINLEDMTVIDMEYDGHYIDPAEMISLCNSNTD